MWRKIIFLALLAFVGAVFHKGQGPKVFDEEVQKSRKLYKYHGDELNSRVSAFSDPFNGIDYRLPNDTKPVLYTIALETNVHEGNFDFTGNVQIEIDVLKATDVITLHYRQLTILDVKMLNENGREIDIVENWTFREDREFLDIILTEMLEEEIPYTIVIDYEGTLRDDEAGFYRSSYLTKEGEEVWLAVTQFESTDARHAFPCYDEPAMRAMFKISIKHHSSYNAISNMPVKDVSTPDALGFVTTDFETTEFVQTYLVAFMVSDFTFVEDNSVPGKPHRVYANPQYIEAGYAELAINASRKLLDGFAEYLGVPYTLNKMDQAAIPDFAAGAMENWGLVTYAEPYLLFDPVESTTLDREFVITTIAHEYAHQWFGDLVSPAWWSFLWMNEGFATLYENHLTDLVFPGERWIDTFLVDTVQPVMETDANPNIRPMTFYVEDPEEIEYLFDNVAYPKSGSVLKMFQNAYGDDTWKDGLNRYLTAKSSSLDTSVATPDDLHAGIQLAVNEMPNLIAKNDVDVAMKSWENQPGFPYINVTKTGNVVTFQQNRFMYSDRSSTNIYHVPINYAVSSNLNFDDTRADFWLDVRSTTLEGGVSHKPINSEEWIIVNLQQSGFYRVNYDASLWNSIVQHLNSNQFEEIHLFNRAQLIDDSHHLARANLLEFDTLIRIMNYLEREDDYIPWVSANRANTLLDRWLTGSRVYQAYREFMKKNVAKLFARYGVVNVEEDQRVDRYARPIAINIACHFQNPTCLTLTEQRVAGVVLAKEKVENELVSSVYCNGLRTANETVFLAFQHKMLQSTSQSERNSIISALGCSQNERLLSNYLQLAVVPEIALTDAEKSRILLSPLNYGEASLLTMINFVRNNSMSLSSAAINSLCSNIANRVSSLGVYNEFSSLVANLRTNALINDTQVFDLREAALAIMRWQDVHLESIAGFFGIEPLDTTTRFPPQNTAPTPATDTTTGFAHKAFASTIAMVSAILIKLLL